MRDIPYDETGKELSESFDRLCAALLRFHRAIEKAKRPRRSKQHA